jgi:hypothetical protein
MLAREVGELMGEFREDDRRGWRFKVTDEAGEVLFTVPLDAWTG